VVFDKTGTLTRGEFRVVSIASTKSDDETLALAAAVERDSEHSIARGIVQTAEERGVAIPPAASFRALPGHGVEAVVHSRRYAMGGPALLRKLDATLPAELQAAADEASRRGQAAIHLLEEGSVIAVLAVADAIREESREAIQ